MTVTTPPAKAAPKVSALSKVLSGLNVAFGGSPNDPSNSALMGVASALGVASGPHMLTPVPFMQAMGEAIQHSPAYQHQVVANQIQQEAMLPYETARSTAAVGALHKPNSYAARTLVDNMLGGQAAVTNDPRVVAQRTLEETLNSLKLIPANERAVILAKEFGIPAQGALPEGSRGTVNGGIASIPGAPAAITANAANRAGGAASATYPYQAALSYHVRSPGAAGATLGPPPGSFVPLGAPGSIPPGLNPAAVRAARMAAIRKQLGLVEGLSSGAQAAGRAAPFANAQPGVAPFAPPLNVQPPPSNAGNTPNPSAPGSPAATREWLATPAGRAQFAARLRAAAQASRPTLTLPATRAPALAGNGLFSLGESVAAFNAQKAIGNQTGVAVEDADKESAAARQAIAIYNQMGQALQQMGPVGAWRDLTTSMGHIANIFGFKPFNIQSAAEFNKYRTQLVGAATKAVSPRASTQEMNFLAQAVPNYNLPGNAAQVLISELRGLSQFRVLQSNALPVYLQSIAANTTGPYRGTSLGFTKWWTNNGPSPSAIVLGSVLSSLPKAQAAQYVAKLRGTVTGKHMLRQYERALKFQATYPGVFKGL